MNTPGTTSLDLQIFPITQYRVMGHITVNDGTDEPHVGQVEMGTFSTPEQAAKRIANIAAVVNIDHLTVPNHEPEVIPNPPMLGTRSLYIPACQLVVGTHHHRCSGRTSELLRLWYAHLTKSSSPELVKYVTGNHRMAMHIHQSLDQLLGFATGLSRHDRESCIRSCTSAAFVMRGTPPMELFCDNWSEWSDDDRNILTRTGHRVVAITL